MELVFHEMTRDERLPKETQLMCTLFNIMHDYAPITRKRAEFFIDIYCMAKTRNLT